MIIKSCRKSRLNGLVAFCPKLDFTAANNEESLTSVTYALVSATDLVGIGEGGGGR